jgi:DNA-binding GntR family transcriptional regulator
LGRWATLSIARATRNKYLADALERFFGLSQRLWYLALPHLGFLPSAIEKHLDLVEAIKAGDADRAEQIMRSHVQDFYDKVREVLAEPR